MIRWFYVEVFVMGRGERGGVYFNMNNLPWLNNCAFQHAVFFLLPNFVKGHSFEQKKEHIVKQLLGDDLCVLQLTDDEGRFERKLIHCS